VVAAGADPCLVGSAISLGDLWNLALTLHGPSRGSANLFWRSAVLVRVVAKSRGPWTTGPRYLALSSAFLRRGDKHH
jgi:hypothetical protein